VRTLEGHTWGVQAVAVTPDGRFAVSGSTDNTLKVWNLVDSTVIATFSGESALNACAVGPDGRTIVAGETSGQVHFLRLEGIGPLV
jgi:WD40 repeat protein